MPITVEWDNAQKTIIHLRFIGVWTWEELLDAEEQITRFLDEASHPLDFIVNFQKSGPLPVGLPAQFRQTGTSIAHPMSRKTVIVGATPIIEIYLNLFTQLQNDAAHKLVIASALDQARAMLKAMSKSSGQT